MLFAMAAGVSSVGALIPTNDADEKWREAAVAEEPPQAAREKAVSEPVAIGSSGALANHFSAWRRDMEVGAVICRLYAGIVVGGLRHLRAAPGQGRMQSMPQRRQIVRNGCERILNFIECPENAP
ncbi:hypothetical protein Busp01_47810 [Trinickia caryophylli]|nr:hypothetical protein [Trinickia caryophylli]GLU34939.1 hypothetical protein Busp01_47810 [Trinickia caryophylli]